MNVGYITELKNVRKHPNADRLLLGDCFGNTVCVSTDYKEGQLGIYFQSGLQLSENFCNVNDLVRRKDENGNDVGGYLDPIKRNIKAISLRGEKLCRFLIKMMKKIEQIIQMKIQIPISNKNKK